jgi:hypothetical protein
MQYLFCIHFKNKTKSGIPFLPLCTYPASFKKICPRKWLWSLIGSTGTKIGWFIFLRGTLAQLLTWI